MTNRAVVIGINDYSQQTSLPPGWTIGNLNFCVADAQAMSNLLVESFGFDPGLTFLTDTAASRDSIIQAAQSMLSISAPGDVACVAYSEHGGRFPADPSNPDRYYEAIIPASGSPITDLDIHNLASMLDQSTVNFTLILDSCNSVIARGYARLHHPVGLIYRRLHPDLHAGYEHRDPVRSDSPTRLPIHGWQCQQCYRSSQRRRVVLQRRRKFGLGTAIEVNRGGCLSLRRG